MTPSFACRLARIALGHVEREYPHKPGYVLEGPDDLRPPRANHPVFFGSFDWHSCVHGYWLLARVLRRFPQAECAADISALFDRRLTAAAVEGECALFRRPSARGFERPYGWAWLLKLAAELPDGRWGAALAPLAEIVVDRFRSFLPIAAHAVRTGSHGNTAFALCMAADYPHEELRSLLRETAWRWYGDDPGCAAFGEPSGDDFLSPTLIEAECMRHLWPDRLETWLRRFLPGLRAGEPAILFKPVTPSDRSDGKIAHLDGLNLSRAWCLRGLGLGDAADAHLTASLPHLDTHYMGEHWLASFALLALGEAGDAG